MGVGVKAGERGIMTPSGVEMMNDRPAQRYRFWLYLGLLLATTLACNLPLTVSNPPPPPPSRSPLPTPAVDDLALTPVPPGNLADFATPAASATPPTVLPTFTPFLAATSTPRSGGVATPILPSLPTPTGAVTPTPGPSTGGPLTLSYVITWRVEGSQAVATVRLTAAGGDGVYTYFHDEQVTAGPVFEYRWATCNPNPGSFRVNSGDGQMTRVNYYETPPCPNP